LEEIRRLGMVPFRTWTSSQGTIFEVWTQTVQFECFPNFFKNLTTNNWVGPFRMVG